MSANKRHHFVPQFYLRNFAPDEAHRQIGLYNLRNHVFVKATSIRSQAQREKLYQSAGGEQNLCMLEGAASKILKSIIEKREIPKHTGEEFFELLVFILFQLARTPTAGQEYEESVKSTFNAVVSHHPEFAKYADQIGIEIDNPVERTIAEYATQWPILTDLWCKLLVNESATPFITSDHPVVLYNQFMERRDKFGSGTGLACKGLQVFLPISPHLTLILYDADVYRVGGRSMRGQQVGISQQCVNALNRLQVANCGDQVFFGKGLFEEDARRLVREASSHRLSARSTMTIQPMFNRDGTPKGIAFHKSKADIRMGLSIRNVDEAPLVRSFQLDSRVVYRRNPALCNAHEAFLERFDRGEYKVSQFGKFLREHLRNTE